MIPKVIAGQGTVLAFEKSCAGLASP